MRRWVLPLVVSTGSLLGCDLEPCLADGDGCAGRATLALAACGSDVSPVALADLLAAPPAPGTAVEVAGPLRREGAICTQLGCATAGGCCNGCGAALFLSAEPTLAVGSPADLRLRGSLGGVDLSCGGDESLVCCPLPTDGPQVVVTGELVEDGVSVDGSHYGVTVLGICRAE